MAAASKERRGRESFERLLLLINVKRAEVSFSGGWKMDRQRF
jgi:hypothetical protein